MANVNKVSRKTLVKNALKAAPQEAATLTCEGEPILGESGALSTATAPEAAQAAPARKAGGRKAAAAAAARDAIQAEQPAATAKSVRQAGKRTAAAPAAPKGTARKPRALPAPAAQEAPQAPKGRRGKAAPAEAQPAPAATSGRRKAAPAPAAPEAPKGGKRALVQAAADLGTLPQAPDFSKDTHKPYRKRLAALVALVEAGDIKGLEAVQMLPPRSTSPRALDRYRSLALRALKAQAAASRAAKK